MSVENSKLFTALAKAQANIKPAGKSGENTYDHYKYTKLEDYWKVSQDALAENGLSLSATVTKMTRLEPRKTRNNNFEPVTEIELTGILAHESGETREYVMIGEGQDRGDKSIYKAVTGARKYLIACIMNIPTTDDPEVDSHEDNDNSGKAQPAGKKEPGKTPPERLEDKQINNKQYEELMDLFKVTKVSREAVVAFVRKKYRAASVSAMTVSNYNDLKEVIYESPKMIDPKAVEIQIDNSQAQDDLPFN